MVECLGVEINLSFDNLLNLYFNYTVTYINKHLVLNTRHSSTRYLNTRCSIVYLKIPHQHYTSYLTVTPIHYHLYLRCMVHKYFYLRGVFAGVLVCKQGKWCSHTFFGYHCPHWSIYKLIVQYDKYTSITRKRKHSDIKQKRRQNI